MTDTTDGSTKTEFGIYCPHHTHCASENRLALRQIHNCDRCREAYKHLTERCGCDPPTAV